MWYKDTHVDMNTQLSRVKSVILYLAEMTKKSPDYTFTSKTVSEVFGITKDNANKVLSRLHNYSTIKLAGIEGRHKIYKITDKGINYANRLKDKMKAEEGVIV